MPDGKTPSIDWGAVADSTRGGSRAVGAARVPRGVPAAQGDRVTILVGSNPTGGENENHRLLNIALSLKGALRAAGVTLRAQEFSTSEQRRQRGRLAELGVDRFPTAVATIGGRRQIAVGVMAGQQMMEALASRPDPSARDEGAVDAFYDKELRSREAWEAAAGNSDESEEIGGVGGDIAADYQAAVRRRGGGGSSAPRGNESDMEERAISGDSATAASLSEGGGVAHPDAPAVSRKDGMEVASAVAAVSGDEDAMDAALMGAFWESNTASD